jgi:IS6 family transposase
MYLYRAVDSQGKTLEFLLSQTRDAKAAKRFFLKALPSSSRSVPHADPVEEKVIPPPMATDDDGNRLVPRVINVDKNAAYPKAIAELKASGILPTSVELTPASNI